MTDPVPSSAPEEPGWRVLLAGAAGFAAVVALIVYAARYVAPPPPQPAPERSALQLDLAAPDALIESRSLAQLPKDLLRVPVLKDALSEDFVFYYQSNADRLGLRGSLRRIAYEHELELRDSVVQELLDQPAQIALWRGSDGKLAHALLRMKRGALAKTLQPLAQAAADDKQLTQVGTLALEDGEVALYRLRYGYDRALLFASHGDDLLVLTSPGMLQASDDPAALPARIDGEQIAQLFAGKLRYAARFGLQESTATHRLAVRADYLALGYGRFVPRLAGLRAEMDDSGWHSFLALDGGTPFDLQPLWRAMPSGPAACAAAPVSEAALQPLFDKLALPKPLAARLGGPVAICWYASSRLHTPLLVTRLREGADIDTQLAQAFEQYVGANEPGLDYQRFPVESTPHEGGLRWQRVVGSDFGGHSKSDLPDPEQVDSANFFRVTLLRHGDLLAFSLDDALADKALATLQQRFPPLAEQLPKDAQVPAYLAPNALAQLLESESMQALPADAEPVFRNAAERHLLPKLRALGTHPAWAVTLPAALPADGRWQWVPMQWKAL
jgi:uncharacterized protein YfaA (DUF2138 family)